MHIINSAKLSQTWLRKHHCLRWNLKWKEFLCEGTCLVVYPKAYTKL